jgi:lipopolysaccharide/colanic/teichoic acid biosynthesis glycosyltransferase
MDDCTFEIDAKARGMTVETTSNGKQRGGTSMQGKTDVSGYFASKVWPARIAGGVLLVLASPIILLLVLLVRLTSSGPGLFRQVRTGRHGKEFNMYKVRTMYNGAESVTGPVWCQPGDSRITPIGKLLRLLHLDELPQLINVARGEMDLIGPRPERPAFVARLERSIPNYRARLQILPGVTGLAQVNLPPDETIDCVRRKLLLDCAYIHEASAGLDLRILLCTALRMVGIRHGHAVHLLGLEREVRLTHEDIDRPSASFSHWLQHDYQPKVNHVNGSAFGSVVVDENGSPTEITLAEAGCDLLPPRMPR